jgi:uncharacterized protein
MRGKWFDVMIITNCRKKMTHLCIVIWIGYLAAIISGIAMSLFGGGGSIITIPVLAYLFGITDAAILTSYSLFAVSAGAWFGSIQKWKDKLIDMQALWWFGLPSILSIFLTRFYLVPLIPDYLFDISTDQLLLVIFALFMAVAGVAMLKDRKEINTTKSSKTNLVLNGLLIGVLSGVLGAGGGFLIVPALLFFGNIPLKTAVGTSMLIIATNTSIGFGADLINGLQIDWPFILGYLGAMILGVIIGNSLTNKIAAGPLKKSFGWFIIAMGLFIVIKELIL